MRCFTACFVAWKRKEIRKNVREQSSSPSYEPDEAVKLLADGTESLKEDEAVHPVSEPEAKTQEQLKCGNAKKAAFDHPNVETDTDKRAFDHPNVEMDTDKPAFAHPDMEMDTDKPIFDHPNMEMDADEPSSEINDSHENGQRGEWKDDKESVALKLHKNTLDDCCHVVEESSESLFSLSIDSRKQICAIEMEDKEVSSHPFEREIKSSLNYDDEDKENVNVDENMIVSKGPIQKPKDSEIVCDTSLSSWLVESEKSFRKGNVNENSPESEKNYRERRVLGAITGGSTLGCNGDDQLIIGTVGRYWLAGRGMHMGRSIVSTKV